MFKLREFILFYYSYKLSVYSNLKPFPFAPNNTRNYAGNFSWLYSTHFSIDSYNYFIRNHYRNSI